MSEDHYIYRGDFDYLAYHGTEEITAVLSDPNLRLRREFRGTIEEGDRVFLTSACDGKGPTLDVFVIVDVWKDDASSITVISGSATSVASSH